MLDNLDRAIVRWAQGDLSLVPDPFRLGAEALGISEALLLQRLERLKEAGALRRMGAILHHRRSGYPANGMAVWKVPEALLDRAGAAVSARPEVTHCYHRASDDPEWEYTLFAMIHGPSEEACHLVAESVSRELGGVEGEILFSGQEYKKVSMRYFEEE